MLLPSLSEISDIVGRASKCNDECRNTSVRSIHQEGAGTSQNKVESPRNKDYGQLFILLRAVIDLGLTIDWTTGDICAPPDPRDISESDPDCKIHDSVI
jgi:hypothetical protein